ncbi:MAG TPA: aspartate dehydrogenase [Stellaceae bacterium]|nr:aspartate dehydrogenase [Stellaceae bacterium]
MGLAAGKTLRVGLGGLGAIGLPVARRLAAGLPGLTLAAVSARDPSRAEARLAALGSGAPVVPLAALAERADIVVECLPAISFRAIAEPAIDAGRLFLPLSVGALLDHLDLVERAKRSGARIIVPTGALLGLDAVRAAAEGEIRSVRLVTRKPPGGLAGAPYLVERGISLAGLDRPLKLFDGTAREGARGFPANVNVAAALALAGIGPDHTRLEIWADPALERNTHHIELEADSARLRMTIENIPSAENPRTGRITPLSVIACLRGLAGTLRIGS